ncbi:MAG: helix-turn-helix domain-containing protein [Armatimonadota bacterium]
MKNQQILNRPGGANGRTPDGWGEDQESVSLAGADSPSTHESVPRSAFTVKEVAESLHVTERFLRTQIADKKIKIAKLGRCVRIPAFELERIAAEGLETQP